MKRPKLVLELQNTRLDGTSSIIWSNLSWQKHGPDKMAAGFFSFYILPPL